MAGQPGKSGGARKGAGRKPKEPEMLASPSEKSQGDPKAFLLSVMNDPANEARSRIDAAKALLPYLYPKLGEGGKKEQTADAAKKVAGRFAAAAPPKLVAAGGKKV